LKLEAERPEWLHGLNDVGRELLASSAAIVPMDGEALLAEARRNTGLDDFGGDEFLEPMRILLDSLEGEARLTLMGRILARSDVLNLLENRLQIEDAFVRQPKIAEGRIDGPIFIVGLPRSGTSILHELLAQDPAHRVPLSWEARFPCPPPETASYDTDPRIERADRIFRFWNELVPAYRTMHEMGGRIPCECIWLTAHSFISEEFVGRQQVPSYAAWLADADLSPAYAYHRRMLQLLQWRHPAERWMLKAPSHMAALDPLLAEYPDARIIMTHRDPLKTMGSTASILSALSWMRSDEADIELIKLGFGGEGMAHRLAQAIAVRDRSDVDEGRFFDVRYADLLENPIESIAGAYAHFGLELRDDVAARMRAYLRAKPQGKHGTHHYAFEDLGLDVVRERARFTDYQQRFGVPSEVR
jgi:hypothetical protein